MMCRLLLSPILTGNLLGAPLLLAMLLAFVGGVWLLRWGLRVWREGQRTNGVLLLLLSAMGLAFPFGVIFLVGSAL